MTVLRRLRILGRDPAAFPRLVLAKMKNGKAVESSIGWFAEGSRNSAPAAMSGRAP
jgi:hypothetical protein